jgi:hypothetical protein
MTKLKHRMRARHIHLVKVDLQVLSEPLFVSVISWSPTLRSYMSVELMEELSLRVKCLLLVAACENKCQAIVGLGRCAVLGGPAWEERLELGLRIWRELLREMDEQSLTYTEPNSAGPRRFC